MYLLNDILLSVDLVCPLDLRPLLMVLYPHLTDEDIDPHVLSFTSHSNNKISPLLVSKYLMSSIVREREPRIQEAVSKLKQNSDSNPAAMSFSEFSIIMERVFPMATNKSKEHYFKCSACNSTSDEEEGEIRVPTHLLGQIAAYIQLQESYPAIVTEINDKIRHYRPKIPSEMLEAGLKQKKDSRLEIIPSVEQSRQQLGAINKAAKSLELLNTNPCWRDDVDISAEYLDLTGPLIN